MYKYNKKLCKICLRNGDKCKLVDASLYNNLFSQLIGVKAYQELWLCTWCVTALKRTLHLQQMALNSHEILSKCVEHPKVNDSNTCIYKLAIHQNQHIDIAPQQLNSYNDTTENYDTNLVDCHDTNIDINYDRNIEPLEIKKNADYYRSIGFEVEYLSKEEQIEDIEKIKLESKYLDKKFKCEDCGIGYMVKDDYDDHILRHKKEHGLHSCRICKLRYKSREVFWHHKLAHSRRFTCVYCSQKIKRIDRHRCERFRFLRMNEKPRPKENKYICHHCDKQFNSKQRLTVHIRSHTGIKPYSCTVCSRSFTTNSNLRTHGAVHTDTKQYYCVECNIYYKTMKSLKRHFAESMRHVNTEDLPYSCTKCSKKFTSEKCLENHFKVRHKTSYKCQHCDKSFYNNANLKKHIRCIHQEIEIEEKQK